MTTPEENSETAETALAEMTFDKLHEGIIEGCRCTDFRPIEEDFISATFTRCVVKKNVDPDDFLSFKEANTDIGERNLNNCKKHCQHRGVSINRLEDNASEIKEKYRNIKSLSPEAGTEFNLDKYVCVFQLNSNAGQVWDDSNGNPTGHRSLLKCDSFCKQSYKVTAVIPIEEF